MRRDILTQTGIITLLMTSFPLMLIVLPPSFLHARASSLSSEPRCQFPKFLQTKRNKSWMMNQSDAITTFDVHGGKIFARYGACIRSRDYPRRGHADSADCTKSNYTRVCLEKRPGNKYLVRHVESDFGDKYVCLQFLERGISVVQVKMSLIQGRQFITHLCDERYMHVDAWPWISEEHYRSPPVNCPFSGGYNLQLKYTSPRAAGRGSYYGTKTYYGSSYYAPAAIDSRSQECMDSSTAPIRLDSDCVAREGMVFNFKHESCLPAGTHVALQQRALCMATWQSGKEHFSMLRADNNDRAFFCIRITLGSPQHEEKRDPREMRGVDESEMQKIEEVMLFFGWVCPTSSYADSTSRSSGIGNSATPLSTPHVALSVLDRQVITEPCSDQLSLCHKHSSFCRGLHCMRTCGTCVAADSFSESPMSSMSKKAPVIMSDRFSVHYGQNPRLNGEDNMESMNGETPDYHVDLHQETPKPTHQQRCTFPHSIRGTWLRRTSDGSDEKIVITESIFDHPRLGRLECVTFSPPGSSSAPLQRVLWSKYHNGCYPRFTCLHYNTPARSVMRFRLADMQVWPLVLSDEHICDQRHFMEPPDLYQPEDKYTVRSWEVVRRSGHIHKLACILPHYIPRVVSFVDDRGRSGCLVHGTYYSPRDISLTYFPKPSKKTGGDRARAESRDTYIENHDVSYNVEHKASDVDGGYDSDPGRKNAGTPTAEGKAPSRQPQEVDYHTPSGRESWIQRKDNDNTNRGENDAWRHYDRGEQSNNYRNNHHTTPSAGTWVPHGQNDTYFYSGHGGTSGRDLEPYHPQGFNGYGQVKAVPGHQHGHHRKLYGHRSDPYGRHDSMGNSYKHRQRRSSRNHKTYRVSYQCLAVMTYVDSFKSLLTVTSGNPGEVLCWLVVNSSAIVILKTSSCNSQTAKQVMTLPAYSSLRKEHVHRMLNLHQGERDCDALFPADPIRPEPIEFRDEDSGAEASVLTSRVLIKCLWSQSMLTGIMFLLHR